MAAELDGIREYLTSYYQQRITEDSTLFMLYQSAEPRRRHHNVPPTPEDVEKFEAWAKEFARLKALGWENDWLEWDYDEDSQPRKSGPPPRVVYDETEEEFRARYNEWLALQPKHVTFPVHPRVPPPTEEEMRGS